MEYTVISDVHGSGELFHRWNQALFLKRNMLTFHPLPLVSGDDIPPTPDGFERRTKGLLTRFGRADSGLWVPMEGVLSPEDRGDQEGWPHIHLVLQEKLSEAHVRLLKRMGRAAWMKVTYSNHAAMRDESRETDLREYVSGHMERHGAVYLAGTNIKTRETMAKILAKEHHVSS